LPEEFPFAVEIRHADFFDGGPHERELDDLLLRLQVDRVIFDSRPLFAAGPRDDSESDAQRRKPNCPVRSTVTGRHPLLRFVGSNDVAAASRWISEWAPIVTGWMSDGLVPFVFCHTADDRHAPDLARAFHDALRQCQPSIPPLAAWPGSTSAPRQKQRELF
jgi:uncharacterized protein YecE (DUF72 family)